MAKHLCEIDDCDEFALPREPHCERHKRILARRTTTGTRGVGVVAAPPAEAGPAPLPSATEAELARLSNPAWQVGEERIRELQPARNDIAKFEAGQAAAAALFEKAAQKQEAERTTIVDAQQKASVRTCQDLEGGEPCGTRLTETNVDGRCPYHRNRLAEQLAELARPNVAPAAETPKTTPPPSAATSRKDVRPMTKPKTDRRECKRCRKNKLRSDNESGICKPCRKELGHGLDPVALEAAYQAELKAKGKAPGESASPAQTTKPKAPAKPKAVPKARPAATSKFAANEPPPVAEGSLSQLVARLEEVLAEKERIRAEEERIRADIAAHPRARALFGPALEVASG